MEPPIGSSASCDHAFDRAEHATSLPWIRWRRDSCEWSAKVFDILGLKPSLFSPSRELFLSMIHPDDEHVYDALNKLEGGRLANESFFRIVRRDGVIKLASLVQIEPSRSDLEGLFCLFDYSDVLDDRNGRPLSRGQLIVHDQVSCGFWSLFDGEQFTLSRAARDILGCRNHTNLTLPDLLAHVHPDDRALLSSALTDPERTSIELRLTRLDSSLERELRFTVLADAGSDSSALPRWGIVKDVTEERSQERRSLQVHELLQSVVQHATDPVAILDQDGQVLSANEAGGRLLGTSPGERIFDRCPALSRDALGRAIQAVLLSGRSVEDERFVPALDRWLEYRVTPVQGRVLLSMRCRDEVYRLKSVIDNLTDRCRAAFQFGRVGLWEYDPRSGKVWFAQSASDFFGETVIQYTEFLAMVEAADRAAVDAAVRQTIETRSPLDIAYRLHGQTGLRRFRSRGGYVKGVLDRADRMVGVLIDTEAFGDEAAGQVELEAAVATQDPGEITGAQVRAARGALRWSVRELSERSTVSAATINRFEADTRTVAIRDRASVALRSVLEEHGIDFFVTPAGAAAIAVRPDRRSIRQHASAESTHSL